MGTVAWVTVKERLDGAIVVQVKGGAYCSGRGLGLLYLINHSLDKYPSVEWSLCFEGELYTVFHAVDQRKFWKMVVGLL